MWYRTKENKLYDYADYKYIDDCLETEIITADELKLYPNKIIIVDNVIELNPNFDKEQKEKERQRIQSLTCTKRVLVLMLEELGLDYFEQIEPLINSNRQAKLEWELASELLRSNPLLDIIGSQLGISPEQIDLLFKYANGEITIEEFIPTVKEENNG